MNNFESLATKTATLRPMLFPPAGEIERMHPTRKAIVAAAMKADFATRNAAISAEDSLRDLSRVASNEAK